MSTFHNIRTFARIINMLLLLSLMGIEVMIGFARIDIEYVNQAALQLTQSQVMVNAAYTLAYRPVVEHGRAMQILQQTLPLFEKEQTTLLKNPTMEVQLLLAQVRTDYLSLDTTVRIIVAHPQNKVDLNEVNILALHERNYLLTMNVLVLILPRLTGDQNVQFFIIQVGIEIVFLILFVVSLITSFWEVQKTKTEKKEYRWKQVLFVSTRSLVFLLLVLLIIVETSALSSITDVAFFNQAALQRTRCEVLTKAAFELAYRPTEEKIQALNDLQVILPLFRQEQEMLWNDTSPDVQNRLLEAQPDFQAVVAASQTLIARPDAVDPAAVNMLVSHQKSCLGVMNNVVIAVQHQKEQNDFSMEAILEGLLFVLIGSFLLFSPNLRLFKRRK